MSKDFTPHGSINKGSKSDGFVDWAINWYFKTPSTFTPFFRQFVNERESDKREIMQLYNSVKAKFDDSPLSDSNAIEIFRDVVLDNVEEPMPPSVRIQGLIMKCLDQALSLETCFSFPHFNSETITSMQALVEARAKLKAVEYQLNHLSETVALIIDNYAAIINAYCLSVNELIERTGLTPDVLFEYEQEGSDKPAPFLVPYCAQEPEAKGFVSALYRVFWQDGFIDYGVGEKLRELFYKNLCEVNKLPLHDKHKKEGLLPHESDLPIEELVSDYLANSPFKELLMLKLPFILPQELRFEHMHIIAGTGHGKTQALQHLICQDLAGHEDEVPSLIIIDSQGDMLAKLSQLDEFNPTTGRLRDRLVIIDPTDVEYPPALGLFDVHQARLRGYDRRYQEQIMNGVIELYDFIFSGLLGSELTAKQSVIFRYLARLMLTIPNATIHTLKDVMQDSAAFLPYFEKLEGSARDFFLNEFNEKQFNETKKQISRRLWGILENQTFERLFSSPTNKLDMFEAMNGGKIILVNTAKDFLKEERSSFLGRFFIALTFQAAMERATLPHHQRRPAFLYIDEAADYFDDTIDSLLTQARKFKLGIVFAHQYVDQLRRKSKALESSVMTNTGIKMAGGLSYADAHTLAPNMGTSHHYISSMKKGKSHTQFATYLRNHTSSAIALSIPFGTLEKKDKMLREEYADMIADNRAKYTTSLETQKLMAASDDYSEDENEETAPPESETTDFTSLTRDEFLAKIKSDEGLMNALLASLSKDKNPPQQRQAAPHPDKSRLGAKGADTPRLGTKPLSVEPRQGEVKPSNTQPTKTTPTSSDSAFGFTDMNEVKKSQSDKGNDGDDWRS